MSALPPTAWFDQFPPPPPGWEHGQWCWRHWAPAPVLGANGIGAATEVMSAFATEIANPDFGRSAAMMNTQLDAVGLVCCSLGDERMYEIWGHWPPGTPEPKGSN